MIKERAWDDWNYYPDHIGIDWNKIKGTVIWPPKTVAIYDPALITGFKSIVMAGAMNKITKISLDNYDIRHDICYQKISIVAARLSQGTSNYLDGTKGISVFTRFSYG